MKQFKEFCEQAGSVFKGEHFNKQDAWGYQLILDMEDCSEMMDNKGYVTKFFKELISELDMKELSPIMIVKVDGPDLGSGRGLSAVQMITTSSITFHSDDDKRCIYLDVFSCKKYNPDIVIRTVDKYFSPKRISKKFLYRDAEGL